MSRLTVKDLTLAALIAAVYAALTVALPIPQYGEVQLRVAEAMTVLPFLFPVATPGLFVGCVIANLFSPYGLIDVAAGSAATLLACLMTRHMPNRWLASLPPVVCNAAIVGGVLAWSQTGPGPGFGAAYGWNALTVGVGELLACAVLGQLLLSALPRVSALRPFIPDNRLPQTR